MNPLLGFAPDLDPCTPGVLVEVENVIPTKRGMEAAKAAATVADVGTFPYPAGNLDGNISGFECFFVEVSQQTRAPVKCVVGSDKGLYVLADGAGGSPYTFSTASGTFAFSQYTAWSFAEYNGQIVAALKDPDPAITPRLLLMSNATSTTFGTASAVAPKADIAVAASDFIVALNTSTYANGWHCSAIFDPTSWTVNVSAQCAKGQLRDGDGPILAGAALRGDVVAFKERSVHVGRYVGAPSVWEWRTVSSSMGCIGKNAVCSTPAGLFFIGVDDFYIYDGTAPRPLDSPVRKWFFDTYDAESSPARLARQFIHRFVCRYNPKDRRVWVFMPKLKADGSSPREFDQALVWSLESNRWGRVSVSSCVWPGIWYDDAKAFPAVSLSNTRIPKVAYLTTGLRLFAHDATAATASFTTGDWGDDDADWMLERLSIRYVDKPATQVCLPYHREALGDDLTTASTIGTFAHGRFDLRQENRWHRFKVTTTGDWEMTGLRPGPKKTGAR